MPLSPGERFGPYEIVAPLGAGGMGEVYRAIDTRLDRTVALKILSSELVADPKFRARFDREARTISQLDHPHVCTLHDVGEHDGYPYLVMQYLEGETLADRIGRAASHGAEAPLSEGLRIGIEIADALQAAHRIGVVHRDLKPGNVMLTKGGAKLLDFGLATWGQGAVAAGSVAATQTASLTGPGAFVGTLSYMPPEQIEGRQVDGRSDIWAFGCVMFEMLTGARPFAGDTPAGVIGSILRDNPPSVSRAVPLSPPALDRVVAKCLAKDPDRRWQSAADLRDELQWIAEANGAAPLASAPSRAALGLQFAGAAAILLGAAAAVAGWYLGSTGERSPSAVSRLSIALPPEVGFAGAPVLSPDGRRLAFVGTSQGRSTIWIRDLEALAPKQLSGTADAMLPFWSRDSRSIGFFADGRLKRINADGTGLQTITDAPNGRGGSWNQDDIILYAANVTDGLYSIPATAAGRPTAVTRLDPARQENSHRFPEFLPDGRRFVFRVRSGDRAKTGAYIASLDDPTPRFLVAADSPAVAPPGFLLFARESTLYAQPFEGNPIRMTGVPVPVAAEVGYDATTNLGGFSVSNSGLLAYYLANPESSDGGSYRLTWFKRDGQAIGTVADPGLLFNPAISPDGRFVAFDRLVPQTGGRNIWIADLRRNVASRVTASSAVDAFPVWSPKGDLLAFSSSRDGPNQVYLTRVGSNSAEERLTNVPGWRASSLGSWSPDGRFLVLHAPVPDRRSDIFLLAMDGERRLTTLAATQFDERQPQFSPDGKWIAYASDESGRSEIYVQGFPEAGRKLRVSVAGGAQPQWRRDGRELFFLSLDQHIMAAPITVAEGTITAGALERLFPVRTFGVVLNRNDYAVDADGTRFLVSMRGEQRLTAPVVIVQNWKAVLTGEPR